MIQKHPNLSISIPTIWRHLDGADVTLKRTVPFPATWNDAQIVLERKKCATEFPQRVLERPVLYIDETHFNLSCHLKCGRRVKGKTTLAPIANFRTKTTSMITALSINRIVHQSFGGQKRGTTAEDFRIFILNLTNKPNAWGVLLVMDNLSIHGENVVASALAHLKQQYNINFNFLPIHSPFLNPIEYSFHLVKDAVSKSKSIWTMNELESVIDRVVKSFTPTAAQGCFSIVSYYCGLCSLSMPFQGKVLSPLLCAAINPPNSHLSPLSLCQPLFSLLVMKISNEILYQTFWNDLSHFCNHRSTFCNVFC